MASCWAKGHETFGTGSDRPSSYTQDGLQRVGQTGRTARKSAGARGEAADDLECANGLGLVCSLPSVYVSGFAGHVGLTPPFPVNPEP